MELSPEEKKRIYEEEKVRLEAQEKTKKEAKTAKAKEDKESKLGCFILIVIILIIALAIVGFKSCNKTDKSSTIDLTASVNFTGTQFVIINIDDFDWTNVILEVNSGLLKGGFAFETQRMSAEETYTVSAMQFAKRGDGTRLNPFTTKPQNFSIRCDTPKGRGYWYGELK